MYIISEFVSIWTNNSLSDLNGQMKKKVTPKSKYRYSNYYVEIQLS